jgi:hypothetical protein
VNVQSSQYDNCNVIDYWWNILHCAATGLMSFLGGGGVSKLSFQVVKGKHNEYIFMRSIFRVNDVVRISQ